MTYYDRQGNPVDMMTWFNMAEDMTLKRVASTDLAKVWVSTVWLGLDHALMGPPLIFETMIFKRDGAEIDWCEEYAERYSTEAAALAGHDRAVAWARAQGFG